MIMEGGVKTLRELFALIAEYPIVSIFVAWLLCEALEAVCKTAICLVRGKM